MENMKEQSWKAAARFNTAHTHKKNESGGTKQAADAHTRGFWEDVLKSAIPSTKVFIFSSDARFSRLNHTQQHVKWVMGHFLEMSVGLFHWSFQHDYCVSPLSWPQNGVLLNPDWRGGFQVNRLPLLVGARRLHFNLHMSFNRRSLMQPSVEILVSRIQMEAGPSGQEPHTEPLIQLQGRPVVIPGHLQALKGGTLKEMKTGLCCSLPRPQLKARLSLHELHLRYLSIGARPVDWN